MSKYIVDIHGEIEGDYEIIGKYEEQEPTTKNDLAHNLCDSCANIRCEFQSGIVRTKCAFYMPPQYLSGLEKNSKKLEKDFGESDCISREQALVAIRNLYPSMPRVDFNGSLRKWVDKYKPYIECDDAIEQLPSVTPIRPKGHWISRWHAGHDLHFHVCSECNEEFSCDMETGISIDDYRYCPNCGADMREVEK